MKKVSKNVAKARKAVEPKPYVLPDAVSLLQKVKFAKFDETVEVTLRLGGIRSTLTRWCAGLWCCRMVWGGRRRVSWSSAAAINSVRRRKLAQTLLAARIWWRRSRKRTGRIRRLDFDARHDEVGGTPG